MKRKNFHLRAIYMTGNWGATLHYMSYLVLCKFIDLGGRDSCAIAWTYKSYMQRVRVREHSYTFTYPFLYFICWDFLNLYTGNFATYEYHMRIICFVSYENHKKGHHLRIICSKSYDWHMIYICGLYMNSFIWFTYEILMCIQGTYLIKSYKRSIICESYYALSYENHMTGVFIYESYESYKTLLNENHMKGASYESYFHTVFIHFYSYTHMSRILKQVWQ